MDFLEGTKWGRHWHRCPSCGRCWQHEPPPEGWGRAENEARHTCTCGAEAWDCYADDEVTAAERAAFEVERDAVRAGRA